MPKKQIFADKLISSHKSILISLTPGDAFTARAVKALPDSLADVVMNQIHNQ